MKESEANVKVHCIILNFVVSAKRLQRDVPLVTSTAGHRTVLPCHSSTVDNGLVYWSLIREKQRPSPIVDSNTVVNGYKERFSLENGSHNLVIQNTSISDSGLYRCSEDGGLGPHHEVTLLVKGKCLNRIQ
jgi:Immunoglobulin V-set domain